MNYLIVGAGLFGATTAHKLAKAGHHVTIIEKRDISPEIFILKK